MSVTVRIATRRSPLALWQARHVQSRLAAAHHGIEVVLVPLTTSGDRWLDQPLAAAGGKGLFVKELEEAMRDGRADIAVHSMKDVPVKPADGLCLAAFLAAEDPRDAFVSATHETLAALPRGARVGTSSLRRQAQLRAARPDLAVSDLRGNVETRLSRLDEGRFDAILLACAGLRRLDLQARIREALPVDVFVPAIGQGVIGIECRGHDGATRDLLTVLNDPLSAVRIRSERAMGARLGGSCQVPVAGHARVRSEGTIHLTGLVAAPDGTRVVRDTIEGSAGQAEELGSELAGRLLAAGGAGILRELGVDL